MIPSLSAQSRAVSASSFIHLIHYTTIHPSCLEPSLSAPETLLQTVLSLLKPTTSSFVSEKAARHARAHWSGASRGVSVAPTSVAGVGTFFHVPRVVPRAMREIRRSGGRTGRRTLSSWLRTLDPRALADSTCSPRIDLPYHIECLAGPPEASSRPSRRLGVGFRLESPRAQISSLTSAQRTGISRLPRLPSPAVPPGL